MPKKEVVNVGSAAPNPNLSPATKFGNLVFVAGQTGRHPVTGEVGKDVREQTRNILERIKTILAAADRDYRHRLYSELTAEPGAAGAGDEALRDCRNPGVI